MTGEQLFFKYQDNGPADYADLLMSIYMAIGDSLYTLLEKAESQNKKLEIKAVAVDDAIGDITANDIAFI